ncbi:MAG: cell filamentation protein Fic, partial [Armatimonadaceae bacterium]
WSFPDLTAQCEYLHAVVRETIDQEMRREADWLQDWRQTRARLKEIVEAPDVELDRLIRSVRENQGRISGKLQEQFPMLADSTLAASVAAAVMGEEDALS